MNKTKYKQIMKNLTELIVENATEDFKASLTQEILEEYLKFGNEEIVNFKFEIPIHVYEMKIDKEVK